MFDRIMVPVDLAHLPALDRALDAAAMMARPSGATVCYVGVSAAAPSPVAHNPQEFAAKLADFAAEQGAARGIATDSLPVVSHDPAIDLNDRLLEAADTTGADLIVMASHIPNLADHLWPAHGGQIAKRARTSVLIVR